MPDTGALKQIVRRINPDYRLKRAWTLVGGVSAITTAIEVSTSEQIGRKLVLRQYEQAHHKANAASLEREFRLLGYLHNAGLPVPEPLTFDISQQILRSPYLVTSFVDGKTLFERDTGLVVATHSAEMLVQIHNLALSSDLFNLIQDETNRIHQIIAHQPTQPDTDLDEPRIRNLLRRYQSQTGYNAPTLIHGDYWPGNWLWRDDRLVGVIDWEDAAINDPLYDVANARLELLWAFGPSALRAFTERYQSLNLGIDYTNLPYWDLIAALKPMGQLASWAHGWQDFRRPDVTYKSMRDAHRWFVSQAIKELDS